MITLTLEVPEHIAAEYYAAAEKMNGRLPGASPRLDARKLMVFALAAHECDDLCGRFDLALRLVRVTPEPPFNPVLGEDFGRGDRPVPTRPADEEVA
jgi:hypothetical protein